MMHNIQIHLFIITPDVSFKRILRIGVMGSCVNGRTGSSFLHVIGGIEMRIFGRDQNYVHMKR